MFLPIIILPLICLFISGMLAVCNNITKPVIEKAAAERAENARREIMPQADGFELLEMESFHSGNQIPKTITEIFRATNDTGYIFMIKTTGYGGDIKLICGIGPDGRIIRTATLAQTETKGLATPVFEKAHESLYTGKDKNLYDVPAVSGATVSSNAYKKGIQDAFTAYEIVRAKQ